MQGNTSLLETLPGRQDGPVISDSGKSLDAARFSRACRSLADSLSARGIHVLALHGDNGTDWVIADMACQLANICLIPLPTFFSPEQIQHVLDTVPVDAVLCQWPEYFEQHFGSRLRREPGSLPGSHTLLPLDAGAHESILPKHTAKITFTSGSTGRPKGVCLSQAQMQKQAAALSEQVGLVRPRHLCVLPLSTLLENIAGVYTPLMAGGEVIVPSLAELGFTGSSSLDSKRLTRTISRCRPHSLILTPQLLKALVHVAKSGWQPPDSLRFVAVGGARTAPELIAEAHQAGIPAYEGYGLSECASVVALNTPGNNNPGSGGRPLNHLCVETEDGEIVVRGNAMLGYVGEPESWGLEKIHTGDLGSIDDRGFVHIEGRKKNLLISSFGRNINPEWVEAEMLIEGSISECVVFGDARPYCVALLSAGEADISDEALQDRIDAINQKLPDYAQVRRWARLPRPLGAERGLLTDNGRPRRAEIASHFQIQIENLYKSESMICL